MSTEIRKLTYQDYVCFPDDGKRHEIIGGDHYMNPAPSTYHQYVSRRLHFQLYSKIELVERGSVICAPVDVQLTESDIVQPDIVVVLKENRIITPTKVKGAPDHLIEILSPSTESNDKTLKRSLYERTGVGEYWIVDPFEQTLTQLVLENGRYVDQRVTEKRISVTYLHDVDVDLNQVW
ncbi:Uma2 family endonuclease [Stieleria maiorica]|nr:Uma2 family endonuclease [Stieleria maiorica]